MNIEEMKEKKALLESEIKRLLNEFMQETKVQVYSVSIDEHYVVGEGTFVHAVDVEVRL